MGLRRAEIISHIVIRRPSKVYYCVYVASIRTQTSLVGTELCQILLLHPPPWHRINPLHMYSNFRHMLYSNTRYMLYLNPRHMLYSNPSDMLYSNPRHMLYSNPLHMFYSDPRQMFYLNLLHMYHHMFLVM